MTELVVRGIGGLRTGFMGAVSVWGFILAIPLAVAALDLPGLAGILRTALGGFAGTLPYVVAAVALIASLKATGATALVARAFEGRETRMIVLAALLGGLAPFCSCEVIPFIAALLAVDSPISAPSSGEVSASSAAHVPGAGPHRQSLSGSASTGWAVAATGARSALNPGFRPRLLRDRLAPSKGRRPC